MTRSYMISDRLEDCAARTIAPKVQA